MLLLDGNVNLDVLGDLNVFLISGVIALAFLFLAWLVAVSIKFRPDHKDFKKRRMWFWIFGILALITSFILLFFVFGTIQAHTREVLENVGYGSEAIDNYYTLHTHYMIMAPIATGVTFVVYTVLGFILSKMFKHKKIGSWF
jgi:magnesium-transporting ATPase (P-type)